MLFYFILFLFLLLLFLFQYKGNKQINKSDEILTKEQVDKITETSPKNKSQSFSFPSSTPYAENEQSVTTIKSNVNDELLQLLNKYYPNKNNNKQGLQDDKEVQVTDNSNEKISKSNDEINKIKDKEKQINVAPVKKEDKDDDNASTSSTSSSEKENILKDSFLPSSVNKTPNKQSNTSGNKDIHKSNTIAVSTPSKFSKKDENKRNQSSIGSSSSNMSNISNSKTVKLKQKKSRIKNIFSPIHRIFNNNNSGQGISKSSSKKSKSVDNINKDGLPTETNTNDTVEDESKYKLEEVLGKGAVSINIYITK